MLDGLRQWIPLLEQLDGYDADTAANDLTAGLTVGVMLIPQGMAYALIAGLPPVYGLYAALLPPLGYALFGTSRQLAVGPTALISLLTATAVGPLAASGTDRYIVLAILLAVLVGCLQFLMGIARLGFVTNLLSDPVLSGFSSAAAFIIGFNQLHHLLGIQIDANQVPGIANAVAAKVGEIHVPTLLLGGLGIALIVGLRWWRETIPAALMVVGLATVASWGLGLPQMGVEIVGRVPEGLPAPSVSLVRGPADIDLWGATQTLLPAAAVIALVGFIESIAVAKVYASKRGYEIDGNQELIGLGSANLVGALLQAFPTTGSFSRTAVSDTAGARTTIAAVVTAVVIGLTLLFLTPLFYFLPKAILAAVIMAAVTRLIDIERARFLWHVRRQDFVLLCVTFLATIGIGIKEGIAVGIVISIVLFLRRSFRPNVTTVGRLPDSNTFADVERQPQALTRSDVVVFRVDSSLYFFNAKYLKDQVLDIMARDDRLETLVFDAYPVNRMDGTAAYTFREIIEEFREQGYAFYFAGVKGEVMDVLRRAGVVDLVGEEHFFREVHEAVEHATEVEEQPAEESSSEVQEAIVTGAEQHEKGAPGAEEAR